VEVVVSSPLIGVVAESPAFCKAAIPFVVDPSLYLQLLRLYLSVSPPPPPPTVGLLVLFPPPPMPFVVVVVVPA
jgi:hypothetical protein